MGLKAEKIEYDGDFSHQNFEDRDWTQGKWRL